MSDTIWQVLLLIVMGVSGLILALLGLGLTALLLSRKAKKNGITPGHFFASLDSVHPYSSKINNPPNLFIGRNKELSWLKENFGRGVIIYGSNSSSGVGKTALARAFAKSLVKRFPGACLELDLYARDEKRALLPDEAMRRLLHSFNPRLQLPDTEAELVDIYRETFHEREVLLLLDNAVSAEQVRPLLPHGLSGVIIIGQKPFTVEEPDMPVIKVAGLSTDEAMRLLKGICERLKQAPLEDLEQLAVQCGHFPLGLRLAGSLLKNNPSWTPARLVERIKRERQRFGLPSERNIPGFEIEALMQLSYDSLGEILQYRFRLLSIFMVSFTVAAAAYVWGCDKNQAAKDMKMLWSLNLMEWQDKSKDYSLYDPVYRFAYEKLLEKDQEAQQAAIRHAKYYLIQGKLVCEAGRKRKSFSLDDLKRFEYILPQLMAAWERMVTKKHGLGEIEGRDAWLSLVAEYTSDGLVMFLSENEWRKIFEKSMTAARRLGNQQLEARTVLLLGKVYRERQEFEWAKFYYLQSLVSFQEINDKQGEGEALAHLGFLYVDQGDNSQARDLLTSSLEIIKDMPDSQTMARSLAQTITRLGGNTISEKHPFTVPEN